MSVGGASGASFNPLASSAAGSQSRHGHVDQQKQASAEQKAIADQLEIHERAVGDVGNADASGDRDADGRLPWQLAAPERRDDDTSSTDIRDTDETLSAPSADKDDDQTGSNLDVEA